LNDFSIFFFYKVPFLSVQSKNKHIKKIVVFGCPVLEYEGVVLNKGTVTG
jgi:hypothetical protein